MVRDQIGERSTFFLHVGLEKTGSTAFQAVLASISDEHRIKARIAPKPTFTKNISSYDLTTLFCSSDMLGLLKRPMPIFRKQLAQFIRENQERDIIWSDEHLSSRLLWNEEIKKLVNMLTSCGHRLVVIMVERDSEDWLKSKYLQSLKGGYAKKYSEFEKKGFRDPLEHDVDNLKVIWNRNCSELVNIHYGVDVVQIILSEIEKRTGSKLVYKPVDIKINKSINTFTASCLLFINRILSQRSMMRRIIVKVLVWIFNK